MTKTLKQIQHSVVNINSTTYYFKVWKVETFGGKVLDLRDNFRLTIMSANGKEYVELKFGTMNALNTALHNMMKPYMRKHSSSLRKAA